MYRGVCVGHYARRGTEIPGAGRKKRLVIIWQLAEAAGGGVCGSTGIPEPGDGVS